LKTRNEEVINLKSKIDVLTKQVSELESVIQQTKPAVKRNEELTESYKGKIAALEMRLREAAEIILGKDMTINLLQQAIQDQKRAIDKQINNLESRLRNRSADLLRSP